MNLSFPTDITVPTMSTQISANDADPDQSANNVDPICAKNADSDQSLLKELSEQGLQCLPFRLHLDPLLEGKSTVSKF